MLEFGDKWGDEQNFSVYCDSCDENYDDICFSLQTFLEDIKDRGWTYKKVNNEWEHYCPNCSEK